MSRFLMIGNDYVNVRNIMRINVSQILTSRVPQWKTEIILKEYMTTHNPKMKDFYHTTGFHERITEFFDDEKTARSYATNILRKIDAKLS